MDNVSQEIVVSHESLSTDNLGIIGIRNRLSELGWARFDADDFALTAHERDELDFLARYGESLPLDRFGGDGRRRAYCEGIVDLASRQIAWRPGHRAEDGGIEIEYQQDEIYQPEYGGVVRRFRRLGSEVLETGLINRLIWHDLDLTPLPERHETLLCGLHMICMTAIGTEPARITPDCLHRDGQPYTAAHLIRRHNAKGGVNYIAPPRFSGWRVEAVPDDQLQVFTLHEALDSYVIDDEAVSHHVTSVSCDDPALPGMRTILLVDFTPVS
ncbi:2OG-Fe dioxygenase family protein [Burkholderia plantarii]|uniref:2OG-Fe dioxygenase family protein n=1 Tax=Burkholderia plantarii TaxID=41899 RepID=A0A0B6S2H0_BURPL|nr:2OG-Fe dioxygenase family protein [Burkholderia plantarii]AJK46411.1 hypothetical protein BGL_1c19020 [Burkholderia plantarii]ALK32480.1 hypothetical protein bpln_2g02070 [Burkholderia plantarii]GLZ19033.1 hypothetical protein Bpla01_25630 [Burkholderia plantarii]